MPLTTESSSPAVATSPAIAAAATATIATRLSAVSA